MVTIFFDHTFRSLRRSVSFSKELATTIFLAFIALMIGGYLLAFGFVLPHLLTDVFKEAEPVLFLHRFLLYYFLFDFVIRYLLQNVPVMDIQPYLHLPIKRSAIINFLLGRSLLHVLNIFILLILAPSAFIIVSARYGTITGLCWISGLWLLGIAVHYLVILYKVKLDDSFWGIILLLSVFGSLGLSDYYGWFKLTDVSALLFNSALNGPLFVLACTAIVVAMYMLNYYVFAQSIYPDEIRPRTSGGAVATGDFGFLQGLGSTGDFLNLELKLILRNKRPRTLLFLTLLFLAYGMIFYPNPTYTKEMPGFLLFVGIFVTGVFMLNYGQYLFSWQSAHLDFTLTRPVSMVEYVNSKYWLLGSVTVICFLLTIPYVYFGYQILLINAAMVLFNLGVNIYILMSLAMWSPKKLDLTKGGAFNVQGAGAAQWVMGLPVFLGPYVFYLPFSMAGYPMVGVATVALVGLAGIIFKPWLVGLIAKRLLRNKHQIAEGFRK